MYARVNIIFGTKGKVGAGLSHLEESDRGAVESAAGNRGLTTLVDRDTGVVVAMSYWDDLQRSCEAVLTEAREGAATAAGGVLVTEGYEVALAEQPAEVVPGAAVQMTRVKLEPARLEAGLAFIGDELVRHLSAGSGLCGAELLIDREAGTGLLVTTRTDQDATHRAQAVLDEHRSEAEQRAGATFPGSESYLLVRRSARSG